MTLPAAPECGPPDIKKDRESAASAYDAGPPAPRIIVAAGLGLCQQNVNNMRAILSVSDKTGLVDARPRAGCARASSWSPRAAPPRRLAAAGLPVVNVSDVTGFPEMMDGRVKTLHPAIHAGILARRHRARRSGGDARPGHRARSISWSSTCIRSARRRENPETPFDELVEEIDIGGPSLLRAAAKNFRDVLVVVASRGLPARARGARPPGGPSLEFRFELMQKAFAHTGAVRRHDRDDAWQHVAMPTGERGAANRPTRRRARRVQRDAALRREPAPEGRVDLAAGRTRRAVAGAPGQGAVVHQPARPRRRRADRARVHRAGGRR